MALGATRPAVVRMILRGVFTQVAWGVAIGVPAALAGGRILADQLFGVRSSDPATLGGRDVRAGPGRAARRPPARAARQQHRPGKGAPRRLICDGSCHTEWMAETGLLRDPDFLKLWTGQAISQIGSSITSIGLPLVAVLILHASPLEMGILGGVSGASVLLFGLFAGAWADRLRRRPILIAADFGRALVVGSVPLAAADAPADHGASLCGDGGGRHAHRALRRQLPGLPALVGR